MNYFIYPHKDLTLKVTIRKPTFSKHPAYTVDVFYRGPLLYTQKETIIQGLLFEDFDAEHAITTAYATLVNVFTKYPFIYKDFIPGHIEYDYNRRPILPHPFSLFPEGSSFTVTSIIGIDRNADYWLELYNTVEGTTVTTELTLLNFPIIKDKYKYTLSYGDSGIGLISKRILGKRFRVIQSGNYKSMRAVEEQ